jgi:hypothetical protein
VERWGKEEVTETTLLKKIFYTEFRENEENGHPVPDPKKTVMPTKTPSRRNLARNH